MFISRDESATCANRTLIRVDKCVRHVVFWSKKQKVQYKFLKAKYLDLTGMNGRFKTYNEEKLLIHPAHYYCWDTEIRWITMNR
jgi:hypothetical protein